MHSKPLRLLGDALEFSYRNHPLKIAAIDEGDYWYRKNYY